MPARELSTALLVDADPTERSRLRLVLREAGLRTVREAGTAAEAIMTLRAEPVHLVLTRWAMPGHSGAALLEALRTRGVQPAPAVVLLDDGLPQAQVVAAVKAGAAARLTLPAGVAALHALLDDLRTGRTEPPVPDASNGPS